MSRANDFRELIGEIRRFRDASGRLREAMRELMITDVPLIGKGATASVAAAGLIESFYTAIETVLFRISQIFGNSLNPDRWHSDLLRRMAITIPDVRPAVISERTLSMLDELMRFRHFKRYYFHLEYDWTRLDYLLGLADRVSPVLDGELAGFESFLESVIAEMEE